MKNCTVIIDSFGPDLQQNNKMLQIDVLNKFLLQKEQLVEAGVMSNESYSLLPPFHSSKLVRQQVMPDRSANEILAFQTKF
jgi:hypothetical protein